MTELALFFGGIFAVIMGVLVLNIRLERTSTAEQQRIESEDAARIARVGNQSAA